MKKSITGKALTKLFNGQSISRDTKWHHFDTDRQIEKRAGRSLLEIAEDHMRHLENDVLKEAEDNSGFVISVGAQVARHDGWFARLRPHAILVWMMVTQQTSFDEIWENRLKGKRHRALGHGSKEEAHAAYREWLPVYRDNKDTIPVVVTTNPHRNAMEVLRVLRSFRSHNLILFSDPVFSTLKWETSGRFR